MHEYSLGSYGRYSVYVYYNIIVHNRLANFVCRLLSKDDVKTVHSLSHLPTADVPRRLWAGLAHSK